MQAGECELMKRMLAVTLGTLLLSGVSANGQESLQRPKLSSVSHLSVYSTDAVKTEHFYVHDLGATEGVDPTAPRAAGGAL